MDKSAHQTAIAAKEIINPMLDQIFGRLFLSQWIVFAVLLVLLVGLSELAWRMGLAGSRKTSEADKDSGTVRSAVLALLGVLLGFIFALACARHVIAIITDIDTPRAGLISVDERPLLELNETMHGSSTSTTP